jgi:glycosyltransferase involved in cell wall biosynthesis
MRILFVAAPPLDRAFGGAKPFIELAEEFRQRGWGVEGVSLAQEVPGDSARMRGPRAEYLRRLLVARGAEFDVIDFDHEFLPYARTEFSGNTLLVARSVLLCQQVAATSFPRPRSLRKTAGGLLLGRRRRANVNEMLRFASRSVDEADLVNVSNQDDADLLAGSGVSREKIVVLPFGLGATRRSQFAETAAGSPTRPVVAFVGTFDWRKGAADMPAIVERVVREVPGARFRLLGTKSIFPTAADVLSQFPARLRPVVEVVPTFKPEELPSLLDDCVLGFFPSYLEGFPFSVLEMLAASLPVFAYDAPGAGMMLSGDFLVPAGRTAELAIRIAALLRDPSRLVEARADAARRAGRFRWEDIAARTADLYEERVDRIRAAPWSMSVPSGDGGRMRSNERLGLLSRPHRG